MTLAGLTGFLVDLFQAQSNTRNYINIESVIDRMDEKQLPEPDAEDDDERDSATDWLLGPEPVTSSTSDSSFSS